MLIKCPECGREVSDKAPTCPHCGVQIAGHVVAQPVSSGNYQSQAQPQGQPVQGQQMGQQPMGQPVGEPTPAPEQPKKSNTAIYIISLIFAIIICGVVYYFYNEAKSNDEAAQYEIAMQSDNPDVLQGYLDTYKDAPQEHRDSIQAHLTALSQIDRDWNDAVISGSRAALQQYLDNHKGSPFEKQALHMIDSIDWASAESANTPDALKSYIDAHPNGDFVEDANELMRGLNAKTVQPEEKQMISSIFRTFFQSVNNKDEDRLTTTVNSLLTTFLGKSDATKSDVVYFMKKLWKDDVQNLNWRILDDYKIDKKEIGNGEYEFSVTFSATQDVQKATGSTENKYRIKAKVNPDGKISEFNMSKVVE